MMGAFVDITERKQAEERQGELIRQLESSNRELRDFARVVSHDLKAPLRAITTLARRISTVHADELEGDGRERVDSLLCQVNRMHELVDGVLEYAVVGSVKGKHVQVDINSLVQDIIDMVARPKNITVMVEDELPVVECEPIHIMQVFQNLLDNSVRFMDKSVGRIRIGCTEDNGFWKFSVADNGPGIEQEYCDRVFELFWTPSFHNETEGTGIGLSVVKKIVEMYGGKVWVESEVGSGSTFFFTFPIIGSVLEDNKAVLASAC
jgi:light-regulated signal transduction histidine kinase (bacteriophytochrome)